MTVHTLSFKRASEMTRNKHKYKVADRQEVSRMMDDAVRWTKEHGYTPYYLYRQKNILGNLENVGYSFPGQESIYIFQYTAFSVSASKKTARFILTARRMASPGFTCEAPSRRIVMRSSPFTA